MSLNSYLGLHAAHYDLIYARKPYEREAAFIADRISRLRAGAGAGSVLDVACGTGRHALELATMGWNATGTDYNPELIDRARASAVARGLDVRFEVQDMRELDVEGRPFDAVTCLFDSIGYGLEDDRIVEALRAMAAHLAPEGVLAVEFLHADAMLAHHSPVKVLRLPTPGGGLILRISETELDRANRMIHVAYELVELKPDTSYERATETQSNRFFTPDEMRALMSRSGLEVHAIVPAYEDGEAISDQTWHLIAFARPAQPAAS